MRSWAIMTGGRTGLPRRTAGWKHSDTGRLPTSASRSTATAPVRLEKDGYGFWLAGLEDHVALLPGRKWGRTRMTGLDDLDGTMAQVTDDAPVIQLAHEPDIFPRVPERVSLTLSGHTHGGQIRFFGRSPIVPSRYGDRYAYGHIVEEGRNIIVSGGLGCSIAPVRFGVPPEIVVIDLG
uniref:Metallophosphoesterase n=1 Tax=Rhizobium etli TaxID=29449 RepID=Q9L9C2_RHIET|nr:unknown [Rhizobium etli]